jgi:aspartate/methionine/tyrosine aminotransferase
MQYKVDSLEGLDEGVQKLYEKQGDSFVLKIDGMPQQEDVSGLKAKVDELLGEKKAAKEAADAAREEARQIAEQAALKSGDVEAITKSWQEKYDALNQTLEQSNSTIANLTSGSTATQLAAKLAVEGSSEVLLPHIQSRLKTEFKDGQPVTVVLGKDGRPSALTVDDLAAEFTNNKAFSHVISGSKARGAGTDTPTNKGGAGVLEISRSEFEALPAAKRMEHVKSGGKVTDQAA